MESEQLEQTSKRLDHQNEQVKDANLRKDLIFWRYNLKFVRRRSNKWFLMNGSSFFTRKCYYRKSLIFHIQKHYFLQKLFLCSKILLGSLFPWDQHMENVLPKIDVFLRSFCSEALSTIPTAKLLLEDGKVELPH